MAQLTDIQLTTEAGVIKNETIANANTADRVGTMLYDIIDSKINLDNISTDTNLGTSNTEISSQNAVKTYVDAKIDTNTALGTSNTVAPSQNAAKVYVDGKINTSTSLGTSDAVAPSQNAVKTYVDNKITTLDASKYITTGSSSSNQSITGSLRINGDTSVTGSAKVLGNATVTGNATINGEGNVVGNLLVGPSIITGTGVTTGDASIELGQSRTGDGYSFIDFHSKAGTDFEARVIRGPGTNGELSIQNVGTGNFSLKANTPGFVWAQGWFGVNRNGTLNTGLLVPDSLTGNRFYTLPDKDGTIALTNDIPALKPVDHGYKSVGDIAPGSTTINFNTNIGTTNYILTLSFICQDGTHIGQTAAMGYCITSKTATSATVYFNEWTGAVQNLGIDWIVWKA